MVAQLPPAVLSSLVTRVMQTSCGLSFSPAAAGSAPGEPWRVAMLPIPGGKPLAVAIGSDQAGCFALASGLLQMAPSELDFGMVEDSLRELVNMVAGHIKRAMSLDQALGLPQIVSFTELNKRSGTGAQWVCVSAGAVSLTVWITPVQ